MPFFSEDVGTTWQHPMLSHYLARIEALRLEHEQLQRPPPPSGLPPPQQPAAARAPLPQPPPPPPSVVYGHPPATPYAPSMPPPQQYAYAYRRRHRRCSSPARAAASTAAVLVPAAACAVPGNRATLSVCRRAVSPFSRPHDGAPGYAAFALHRPSSPRRCITRRLRMPRSQQRIITHHPRAHCAVIRVPAPSVGLSDALYRLRADAATGGRPRDTSRACNATTAATAMRAPSNTRFVAIATDWLT